MQTIIGSQSSSGREFWNVSPNPKLTRHQG